MRKPAYLLAAASILGVTAGAALAQTSTFQAQGASQDAFEDLIEQIEDDAERDIEPFGNVGRPLGFDGEVALRGSLSSGNTDNVDLAVGANLGYYDGTNGYRLTLNYAYGEDDGDQTEGSLLYGLEYTRDFGDRWYGYAQLQGAQDDFGPFESDTFAGVGVGYKVIERADVSWAVSGGPGYRWAELSDGSEIEEEALSINSNYTARIADNILGTMDTSIIHSSSDTVFYNDAAISVGMGNSMALRTSLATEYHTDPVPGSKDIDNTLGVSLVYSFN